MGAHVSDRCPHTAPQGSVCGRALSSGEHAMHTVGTKSTRLSWGTQKRPKHLPRRALQHAAHPDHVHEPPRPLGVGGSCITERSCRASRWQVGSGLDPLPCGSSQPKNQHL